MAVINANFAEAAAHAADDDVHVTAAEKETWDETGADLTGHMTNTNNPHGTTAAQVPYSNTSSGMAAETAQAALDELCTVSARTSVTALMIPHGRSAILTMPTVPVCCGEIATASNSSANVCSTHLFYGLRTATPKLTTIDSCTLIAVAASAGAITITNSATTVDAYCYITHKTSAHATIELVPEGGT